MQIEKFLQDITFKQETDSSVLLVNCIRVFNELVKLPSRIISVISKHVKEMAIGMASFQERGSEKGIPSSTMSHPASASTGTASSVDSTEG